MRKWGPEAMKKAGLGEVILLMMPRCRKWQIGKQRNSREGQCELVCRKKSRLSNIGSV
jgi:hypothetical protein